MSIDGGELGGGLAALGGRIEIGGVEGIGTVALSVDQNLLSLSFPDDVARANITLTNRASLNLSGEGGGSVQVQAAQFLMSTLSSIFSSTVGAINGGNIFIRATDTITVDNSAILTGVSTLFSNPQQATGRGGDITIWAKQLNVTSNFDFAPFALGQIGTNTFGIGDAGNINVIVERLLLANGGQLTTDSSYRGRAGDITVHASEAVEVTGTLETSTNSFASGLFSETFSREPNAGAAGNLTITTKRLTVQNDAAISTQTRGAGDGGKLEVIAEQLFVQNGGQIRAGTRGAGQGGTLTINASDLIQVSGTNGHGGPSGLFTATDGFGNGGDLTITTRGLEVLDGATISASSFAISSGQSGNLRINASEFTELSGTSADGLHSRIVAETGRLLDIVNQRASTGGGGSLTLGTGRLVIRDGAEISTSTFGQGSAGDIQIQAVSFNLIDEASILSRSTGQGRAGNIGISVNDALQSINSEISTSSIQSSGGAITLAARTMRFSGDSDITTSVFSGVGNGGNITLTADSIISLGDSDILAFAQDGSGGNITLNTPAFFGQNYRPGSPPPFDGNDRVDINASGTVSGVITLPDTTFLQNSLTQLSQNLLDTGTLLANSCIVRSRERNGTFFIKGSGALPVRPGDAPLSGFPTGEIRTVPEGENRGEGTRERRSWKLGDPIVEPQGVYQLPDGRLVLSRECEE